MTDRKWSKRPGYLARYALTKGIQSATFSSCINPDFARVDGEKFGNIYRIGTDVFWTLAEAVERAEELRAKRIASLQKQIKALQDKRFTVSEVAR